MSIYSPPTQNVAIFDTELFKTSDKSITQGEADKRYLRFPIAQGTETLQTIAVNGVATFNNTINQVGDFTINQDIPTTDVDTRNQLKPSTIISGWPSSTTTATLAISDSISANTVRFHPNISATNFGSISRTGDATILNAGGSRRLNVTVFTSGSPGVYTGLKVTDSNTSIGFGGTGVNVNPTNAVICDASGVTIRPSITFPDGKVQTSAFTGGTAGTYTNTNMTIDANGRISAISNGTVPVIPFAPRFTNYADYQSTGSGYSQGTTFVCNGSWGKRDYIILRITAQGNWIEDGAGWRYYATTSGQLIFRPFYAPSGNWANNTSTRARYTTNSGNANIGNVKKALFYSGAINNGTQDFFYIYGESKEIQFQFLAPGSDGGFSGWAYTHLIEYIVHSSSGGTVSIEPGTGIGATNNVLP